MAGEMKPGNYIVLGDLLIRASMDTTNSANIVGKFFSGNQIKVFEIMPEKNGILWGRVSETTGQAQARFIGMRVNNNPKVQMQKTDEASSSVYAELVPAINRLAAAIENLASQKLEG